MARNIHCVECGVVLSLPDQAEGRKLKCPKCGAKFLVGGAAGGGTGAGKAPPPANGSPAERNADSTFILDGRNGSAELPLMPTAAGDLRETFDVRSMTGAAEPAASVRHAGSGSSGGRQTADALALFDDRPIAPKRKTGAEARSQARRCPTCGGVVPQGMSLCQTCGLDLETGMRVVVDDDLAPPMPSRGPAVPLPIAIIGGICCGLSALLVILAFIRWQQGAPGVQYFIPVAGFGVYAAVQFLRGKSVKLLLAALTLGAVIDVAAYIALPIYYAQIETVIQQVDVNPENAEAETEQIRSVADQLDTNKLTFGIALLSFYAIVSIYLLSPPVQRHFRR